MKLRNGGRVPELKVRAPAAVAVRRGHPWVWREGLAEGRNVAPGDDAVREVQLVDDRGELLGRGLYEPGSPLAVRVWTEGALAIDETCLEARIAGAFALRAGLFPTDETTAYRLIHGEGDHMPGLILDRYGHVAVLQTDGRAGEWLLDRVTGPLVSALGSLGVETLLRRTRRTNADVSGPPTTSAARGSARGGAATESKREHLHGPPAPDRIVVREHGVPFEVDVLRGQKTGAFLDQRENRRRVGELSRGRRSVLNLFSYAGGFSLRAALSGAAVTSVDVAAAAHASAQASFRAAGLDPRGHEFVTADAFAFLEQARRSRRTWDVVVSDPPSFAPSEKALRRGMSAYRALHNACAAVLAPGGVFCAASCSSHVNAEAFLTTLDAGALGRADLRLLELHGAPADHPTRPAWPEGRYLKFAILA